MLKSLIIAAAISATSVAHAATDLSLVLKDEQGQPAQDQLAPQTDAKCGDKTGFKCLTLGAAAFHALVISADQADNTADGEAKFKRGKLADKVNGKDSADLTAEDVTTIKQRIGKVYGPWIVKQAWEALDPALAK